MSLVMSMRFIFGDDWNDKGKNGMICINEIQSQNIDLYFIIQQLSLNKLFKCDCVGHKKKHGFGSFQSFQN